MGTLDDAVRPTEVEVAAAPPDKLPPPELEEAASAPLAEFARELIVKPRSCDEVAEEAAAEAGSCGKSASDSSDKRAAAATVEATNACSAVASTS